MEQERRPNKQVIRELYNEEGILRRHIPLSHKYFVCGFDDYDDSIFMAQGFETREDALGTLGIIHTSSEERSTYAIFDNDGFPLGEK